MPLSYSLNQRMIPRVALAFPPVMVVAAPAIAMAIHRKGLQHHGDHYRELARALEEAWRARSDKAIAVLGGDFNLVNGTLFYLRERAVPYFILAPRRPAGFDDGRIAREGMALVCPQEDCACVEMLKKLSANSAGAPTEITLVRNYLGVPGRHARYVISVVQPQPERSAPASLP